MTAYAAAFRRRHGWLLKPSRICLAAPKVSGYRHFVVGVVNGNTAHSREGDAAQAEYHRQELSALRAQAQSDIARNYIDLQQLQNAGLADRASHVRRVIRALERELMTLDRLGEGLNRWL